jgi:hypothetical protein
MHSPTGTEEETKAEEKRHKVSEIFVFFNFSSITSTNNTQLSLAHPTPTMHLPARG